MTLWRRVFLTERPRCRGNRQDIYLPWRTSCLGQTTSTWPPLTLSQRSVLVETLKKKKQSVNRQSTINTSDDDGQEYKRITSEWWWHWWHISDVIYWNKKNQLRVGSNRDSGSVLVQYWSEFQDWTINKKLHLHTIVNWRSSCSCRQAPGVMWRSDQLWSTNKKTTSTKLLWQRRSSSGTKPTGWAQVCKNSCLLRWWTRWAWWVWARSPGSWCSDPALPAAALLYSGLKKEKRKILVWPQRRDVVFRGVDVCGRLSHRLCGLVLSVVQLVAVVEDVVKGRVEAGFDTVPHHLTGPGWRLQFLDLTTRWRRSTSEKCCHLWFPKTIQKHMIKKFHSNLHPEEGDAG